MPTAGSCGIVPAVLISIGEEYNKTEEDVIKALITASGLGAVVVENATVAGSEGGCQAECGVAAAMAAAGAVELKGGTPAMSMEAFSFSLINIFVDDQCSLVFYCPTCIPRSECHRFDGEAVAMFDVIRGR